MATMKIKGPTKNSSCQTTIGNRQTCAKNTGEPSKEKRRSR